MKKTIFFTIIIVLFLGGGIYLASKTADKVEEASVPAYLSALDLMEKPFEIRTYTQNIELERPDSIKVKIANFPEQIVHTWKQIVVFDTISVPVYKTKAGSVERWDLIDTAAYTPKGYVFVGRFGDPLWLIRRKKIRK